MSIFDEVNSLPETVITRRLGLSTARDGKSFLCPDCGNGSGKSGDGIKQSKLKGKLVWHCYRCGGHWSNVDLVALVEGIAPSDTAELGKKLEEMFPESSKPFLFSGGNFLKSPHARKSGRAIFSLVPGQERRAPCIARASPSVTVFTILTGLKMPCTTI